MKHLIAIGIIAVAASACRPPENPMANSVSALECLSNTTGQVVVTMKPTADAKGSIRFNVRTTTDNGAVFDYPEKSGDSRSQLESTEVVFLAAPKRIIVTSSSHGGVYWDLGRFDPAKICGGK